MTSPDPTPTATAAAGPSSALTDPAGEHPPVESDAPATATEIAALSEIGLSPYGPRDLDAYRHGWDTGVTERAERARIARHELLTLTRWMLAHDAEASEIADALARPSLYDDERRAALEAHAHRRYRYGA